MPTASLQKLAAKYTGIGYRFHNPKYFYTGGEFWKTFEDGPWKWKAHERYSLADCACGHYFSLAKSGAEAEAKFYSIDLENRLLLEVCLSVDKIVDLTVKENIVCVMNEALGYVPNHYLHALRIISHEDRAGNAITDEIGWWAMESGFSGIRFFSSRSLEPYRDSFAHTGDAQWGVSVVDSIFNELRTDLSTQCLVLFEGANLVRSIGTYRTNQNPWLENEFHQCDYRMLSSLGDYGAEYRKETLEAIYALATTPTYRVGWDGKVRRMKVE